MQNQAQYGPAIAQMPPTPAPPGFSDGTLPAALWQGAVAARRELTSQRNNLQSQRREVAGQLRDPMVRGADRVGLEQQITAIDANIAALDKEIAAANSRVASTALVPGAVVEQRHERNGPPDEVYVLSGLFMVVVLFPLSVAFALRTLRRGRNAIAALPQQIIDRFDRLDQAVDAMSVEVERIGENQRFVTRLMSERPAPEPLALERDRSSPR
jgi:hypothetical protein